MMHAVVAALAGALITVMNQLNSALADASGGVFSALVSHVVGLALLVPIAALAREERRGPPPPAWMRLGGVVGAGTFLASTAAFSALGASLAVALALLGQTLASLAVDASGPLGRPRFPPRAKDIPAVVGAVAGVAVMTGGVPEGSAPSAWTLAAGLLGGALPVLAFLLNSTLGGAIGPIRAARTNFATGLATFALASVFFPPDWSVATREAAALGPLFWIGGGALGVAVVVALNVVYPRLPAFLSSLLLFTGQAAAGIAVDLATGRGFRVATAMGAACILAGLGARALMEARTRTAER